MSDGREARLADWLAGDRAGERALGDDLAADPAFAERAGELLAIERLLAHAAKGPEDGALFASEVVRMLSAPDSGRRFARRVQARIAPSRAWRRLCAAALVAVGVLAAAFGFPGARAGSVIATLHAGAATCERAADGAWIPASGDLPLHRRDRLRVVGTAPIAIAYADGTGLTLAPGTVAEFDDIAGAKTVRIDAGTLSAEVAKQPAGRPLALITPHARAEVVGTRFTLAVTTQDSTLTVSDGAVRMATASGATVVARGGAARSDAAGTFVLRSRAADGSADLSAGADAIEVRRFDIGDGERSAPWNQGRVVAKPGRGDQRCLSADVDEAVSPRMMAACAVDWSAGLLHAAPDDQLQFEFLAPAGVDHLTVWFFDSTSRLGFWASVPVVDGSTWSRATLRLSSFHADDRRPESIRPDDTLSFLRFWAEPKPTEPFLLDHVRIVRIPATPHPPPP